MSESPPESRAMARLVTSEEREQAVQALTAAFADDAMPVDEFERRVADVYRAESTHALQKITRDLPATAAASGVPSAPDDRPTTVVRQRTQQVGSVMSSIERSLQGPMPERLDVRSVMGSVELDLRGAEFPSGVTEIRVRAVMGNIELELPEHVRVENEGSTLLGNFSVGGRTRRRGPDRRDDDGPHDVPIVRITGHSIFANVEVEIDD